MGNSEELSVCSQIGVNSRDPSCHQQWWVWSEHPEVLRTASCISILYLMTWPHGAIALPWWTGSNPSLSLPQGVSHSEFALQQNCIAWFFTLNSGTIILKSAWSEDRSKPNLEYFREFKAGSLEVSIRCLTSSRWIPLLLQGNPVYCGRTSGNALYVV